jgi:acetyl/propionyl-CoA carboxylase alpha subunit/acetyl-CoA carboxylase carboxyltransferase component
VSSIHRLLIANRGEIAIRIAQAARGLGIETVGIHAPADALNLHTRVVDSSVCLRPEPGPVGAYLDVDTIIRIAKDEGCDAIHPGYGFLSENAEFAALCAANDLVFVGPGVDALKLFGDKIAAKALAAAQGIPVVPGSEQALRNADDAAGFAKMVGYPIILKAAAGGGGRGMRAIFTETEVADALARAGSEAQAAFGNGAIFAEKLIQRPRHIEIQVLADHQGNMVHLFERDCSIQQRHQKLIEIAPAPHLDASIRDALCADATKLARAAGLVNAATVEFLVEPESGNYYFIECNPRIQVEHTITEQVMAVDLVEAQLHIAAGSSLSDLGIANQAAVGRPRGFAIQTRVVAQGSGTLSAYKEPTGMGRRVDGHGYVGYTPPPEYDPLLAKLICHHPTADYAATVARTRAALDQFHIAGLATNLNQLRSIMAAPAVEQGDARTSLLSEIQQDFSVRTTSNPALTLLDQQAKTVNAGGRSVANLPAGGRTADSGLTAAAGQRGVEAPMAGSVVELSITQGDQVKVGDSLMVISAMKMESAVTAPCSGTVDLVANVSEGDAVAAGQVLVLLTPTDEDETTEVDPQHSWQPLLDEADTLRHLAHTRLQPGSDDPGVVRQRDRGKLTCRERIDLLLDAGSFREVGSLAGFASYAEDGTIEAFTPANHVGGWGEIAQRTTVVCADDFTSRGGHADGAIGAKSLYLDRLSMELRVPSVRLLDGSSGGGSVAAMVPQQKKVGESGAKESSGAIKSGRPRVAGSGGSFLPGHLGSAQYTEQLSTVPVVNMLLGSVVGIGAAKAVLGHFSVMVRDIAQLFVAGPPVVSHAMGYDISKEDLGGWHIHCTNGSVDNLAESEEEAVAMTKRFLSYLPSSVYEAPPVQTCSDPVDRAEQELLTLIPRKRTATFDIRKAIRLLADKDSFFEIGPLWGTDQVTGFVRCNGHSLGVIASDSRHVNGGALTADGCDKLKRHLDLCDTFHIPVLNLIDNPGFAVGLEHELTGTIRKGGEWMVAFAQIKVPVFSVLMRRSFGVAGNNYATPLNRPNVRVAWPAADVGGIPPEGGIEAAYKRQLAEADDPAALRAELNARIESARGPIGPLNRFQVEEMVDPRETRRLICEWVSTAYRIVQQPDRLGPRPLQFRP